MKMLVSLELNGHYKYINMLSKGGSMDSISLLRMVDVDLENAETYDIAFKYFETKINELKNLL